MAKQSIRFGELSDGADFEYAGRMLKKITDLRAASLVPRQEFIFKRSDLVKIQVPDKVDDDDNDIYPMYGLGGMGSAAPDIQHPLTSDDLADMYGVPFGGGDRCN
jgi:hypothetical protein